MCEELSLQTFHQIYHTDGALNPKNYETYNCGSGQTVFGDEIELNAEGTVGWPDGHFCLVIAKKIPCEEEYMYFEMDVTSLGSSNTDEGHPALIFNWQDEANYEFVYYRYVCLRMLK